MKTTLSTQLGQQLHLTPALLQSIGLLQLNGVQLEQHVKQVLAENPLLELEEEASLDSSATNIPTVADAAVLETAAFDELPESVLWEGSHAGNSLDVDDDRAARLVAGPSTDVHLRLLQEWALELDESSLALMAFWLEHCDDMGYLTEPLAELVERASQRYRCSAEYAESIRQHLLHGEPGGMAAQDLRECLQVQLADLPGTVPGRPLAQCFLAGDLELLSGHDYSRLATHYAVEEDAAQQAVRLILSLQPRPAQSVATENDNVVIPDVVAWRADGQWRVALNPQTTPKVWLNPLHERALTDASAPTSEPLRALLHQARWFSRGLATRHDTLLRTAKVIVERQAAFLAEGDEALAPLTLKEVAECIGMHESTVSRITSGKYLQTPRGTFELKHFFAVRLEGASLSGTAIKARIRRLIETEPQAKPLADETIACVLARQGLIIARRTVTKYREQLGIAGARARRRHNQTMAKTA